MKFIDIAPLRQHNQGLIDARFKNPIDVVSWLGAVQAQDYAAAKWALGVRIKNSTDATIEDAYNQGEILRTHIMRPTWHFVSPKDIRALLELTAPRVKAILASYNRKLELDDDLFAKSNATITKSLRSHKYLTRQELKLILRGVGIESNVQRLAHIVIWAELDGLICSGPRRGKQFTYALLEERVPKVKKISRNETLSTLTLKYFTGHGPAQLKDFAWWSGLSVKDAQLGLDLVKSKLKAETIDEKMYWFSPDLKASQQKSPMAHLLSIFDEYTIAYKDRSILGGERYVEKLLSMGNALTAVITIGGAIVGTWKRTLKKDRVEVKLSPFRTFDKNDHEAVEKAVSDYGTYLGLRAILT